MPGSDLEALIAELEELINSSKSPLSGGGSKKIIDADTAYEILDDFKLKMPDEFQKARRILRERDEILDGAESDAKLIRQNAEDKAAVMVSEMEIVRAARVEAEDIKRAANDDAREIRYWAEETAEQTFAKLEEEMRSVIEKTQGLLSQMSYCRALLNGQSDDSADDRHGDAAAPRDANAKGGYVQ